MTHSRHFLHSSTIPVRWGDMDAYGHVNNATYFQYFEEARINWFNSINFNIDGQGTGPVLVKVSCSYLKPIVHPAIMIIKSYGGVPGRSSFPVYHDVFLESDPETLYTQAEIKVVWINHETEKSIPLPDQIREQLPTA